MEIIAPIEAIFIDTGGTLRSVIQDPVLQSKARMEIARLLEVAGDPQLFFDRLEERYKEYKKWAKQTLIEPSEVEFWTRWMLPDRPAASISLQVDQLTRLWMDTRGRRIPRPDARQIIQEFFRRGYLLGIIANSVSTTEIPEWLEKEGFAQFFKVVLPSSKFGRRKPDPAVFIEAARLGGMDPVKCAYVGDNPSRDIEGARQAGFSRAYILLEQATLMKEPPKSRFMPDGMVGKLSDLLYFFPPIN
jgi:FMN phosphatase YigB (HAD superfamily)